MISSMTGFGAADGVAGGARVSVEIRTVNHRFFSPNLKIPAAYGRWEAEIRELLRQRIARGHVTLTVRGARDASAMASGIDEARFAQHLAALRALKTKYSVEGSVDLSTLLRLPDVVSAQSEVIDPDAGDTLTAVVTRAIDALMAMRRAEGAKLAAFLTERVSAVQAALARIEQRAPIRLKEDRKSVE